MIICDTAATESLSTPLTPIIQISNADIVESMSL